MKRRTVTIFILIFLILASAVSFVPASAATPAAIQGLHVSGNKIVNTAGQTVRLFGVNRSGG